MARWSSRRHPEPTGNLSRHSFSDGGRISNRVCVTRIYFDGREETTIGTCFPGRTKPHDS